MDKRCCRFVLLFVLAVVCSVRVCAQTALPQVKLWSDSFGSTFASGRVALLLDGDTLFSGNALVRHRGATALAWPKKSYALKLIAEDGSKQDVSLLGMRKDNYWILDAAAIDRSRMRNRVSTDLWLDFSRQPQSMGKTHANGTHGQWVELWVNDLYNGLYCLTERIDRKQLGLKKCDEGVVRGYLAKAVKWNDNTCWGADQIPSANDALAVWGGFEAKYPDADDGEPWTWQPLTEILNQMNCSQDSMTYEQAGLLIDMPVFIDYLLLVYLLEAEDNLAKNYYLANVDIIQPQSLWFVTPWDMDHAWGRRYDGKPQDASVLRARFIDSNCLAEQLNSVDDTFWNAVCARYAELRDTYFRADSLDERFRVYARLFAATGAWQRDSERWSGTTAAVGSLNDEVDYISQWTRQRLELLDSYFVYASGIDLPSETDVRHPHVYTLDGVRVPAAVRPGIYIINGRKVVVGGCR